MAQINKPNNYFNTVLYTGNGSTQSITGVNFQPDFTWIKDRSNAYGHDLYDVIRGATNRIQSNDIDMQSSASGLTSFDSDGFSLGSYIGDNTNTANYVSWNWLASNSSASNTDGSITSTVSANTTSGFSIIKFDGTEANGSVGHGLGVEPSMFILRRYTDDGYASTTEWYTYHKSIGGSKYLTLQSTSAQATNDGSLWNTSTPVTSSVINIGFNANSNNIGTNSIIYAFAEKKGFSKFGSYTGNGSTDGPFIYTGFKPAFVITKCTSTSSIYTNWGMFDSKRPGYNQIDKVLGADLSDSENGSTIGTQYMDFLSNGFKPRNNGSPHNISGASYIYMAFAENPLVGTNNIPATAR